MITSTEQIVEQVTAIVARELGVLPAAVAPGADLRTFEGADSVKMLRVVAKVEQTYDVELDDSDVFAVSCVADVASVVRRALQSEAA